jgi:predicted transposase YdaD
MISKTPEERLQYEMRMKALRDQRTNLEAAERRGLEAGRVEGREEGRWIGKIQTLQELLGEPVSKADELATWDLGRLQDVATALQARLRSRPT